MICNACADGEHDTCQTWVRPDGTVRQHESKTWCDCQHKPHIPTTQPSTGIEMTAEGTAVIDRLTRHIPITDNEGERTNV